MQARLLFLLAAAAGLAACDDPNDVDAEFDVSTDTLAVLAINNSQGDFRNGIALATFEDGEPALPGPALVPVDAAASFDVAFDIDESGRAVAYPLALVVPGATARQVGIQLVEGLTFDQLTRAPRDGYETGKAVTLEPGQVLAIEAQNPSCFVRFGLGDAYYAKLVVDSVRTDQETVYVRVTSDPNCGFRSLTPGRPRD